MFGFDWPPRNRLALVSQELGPSMFHALSFMKFMSKTFTCDSPDVSL